MSLMQIVQKSQKTSPYGAVCSCKPLRDPTTGMQVSELDPGKIEEKTKRNV